jgi:hypothetical protein
VTDGTVFSFAQNPIPNTAGVGTTTLTWAAPSTVQYVEIRIGSPNGPLFTVGTTSGSATTGNWVTDGMIFYLQDVTYPKNLSLTASNTLATAIAVLQGVA